GSSSSLLTMNSTDVVKCPCAFGCQLCQTETDNQPLSKEHLQLSVSQVSLYPTFAAFDGLRDTERDLPDLSAGHYVDNRISKRQADIMVAERLAIIHRGAYENFHPADYDLENMMSRDQCLNLSQMVREGRELYAPFYPVSSSPRSRPVEAGPPLRSVHFKNPKHECEITREMELEVQIEGEKRDLRAAKRCRADEEDGMSVASTESVLNGVTAGRRRKQPVLSKWRPAPAEPAFTEKSQKFLAKDQWEEKREEK
ncbi:hypothetical protein PFISCL1PPCAC_26410, partial [Pristionchus fissidentatus]